MSLYNTVEKFVQESFVSARGRKSKHSKRTVFWIKKIYPEADEAMLIAAISHDIERAFRKNIAENIRKSRKGFLDEKHMEYHQAKGAEIVAEFLLKNGADEELVNRVKELIEKHEMGGNMEQNILKDADSISFFENNVDHFIKNMAVKTSKNKVRKKFDFMFERISSEKAKEIAKPWYDEAVRRLEI